MKIKLWMAATAIAAIASCETDNREVLKKLDELSKKVDAIAQRPAGGPGGQRPAPAQDPSKTYAVPVDGDPFDGPADAAVTVVKAYDYACPFCERVRPTMEELHAKYGKDLRVVYKQLVVHPKNAMAGALAVCAAAKQGNRHKEMDSLIWEGFKARQLDNSDVTPEGGEKAAAGTPPAAPVKCWDTPAGCANVVGYAQKMGLNVDQFKADMKGSCMQLVQNDMRHMQQFAVRATPAFFINGRFLSGAQPTAAFVAVIDEELKKAKDRIAQGTPAAQYYQKFVVEAGAKAP